MANGFSNILVCCDGSKYSKKAIMVACQLAKKYGSSLTLIHVVNRSTKSDILAGSEYTKILIKYARETLDEAKNMVSQEGLEAKTVTVEGNIAEQIINYSKKDKTDLIVVGSKGLGAVLRFLIGSVSSKVASHSMCSVLIVK